MRYPAAEKLEIIRLVEQSHLPVRRTLAKIGIPPTTFYRPLSRFEDKPLPVAWQGIENAREGGSGSSTAHFANDGFHALPGSAYLHAREGRKAERDTGSSRSAGRCSLPLLLPGRRIAKQFCREGTFYDRRAIMRDPDRASARAKSDAALSLKIDAAWDANRKLYGARKIWHVLRRQGEDAARCTVERLMRRLGIRGVVRGKKVMTTNPDTSLPCPDDIGVFPEEKAPLVNRLFMADRPNKLWVSDFTYVPTWSGTIYVAFVIDVFARRIVALRDLHANPFRVTAGASRHR